MSAKRNDVEEASAAEREIAFKRVLSVSVLVLVILFGVTSTTPSTESRSIWFSIRVNLVGGNASTHSEGECAEDAEIICASVAMPEVFDVVRRMMGEAWADPKPFEMAATFADEDGKARLTMRMVLVPAEPRAQYAKEYGDWRLGRLQRQSLRRRLAG